MDEGAKDMKSFRSDGKGTLWEYVGEGARNVVFRYKGKDGVLFRRVIRVAKELDSTRTKKDTGRSFDWISYNAAFQTYLGENITCAMRHVDVDRSFLVSLQDVLRSSTQRRHPKRRHLSIDILQKHVIEMPDYTFVQSRKSMGTDIDASIHWSG